MAITSKHQFMWDPMTKPVVGSLCMDHYTMQIKVFDGTTWILIPGAENLEDINLSDLQQMIKNRKNMSDGWLESKYTDLKDLRERYEEEYDTLRDKYKVFEILNLPGVNDVR